MNKLTKRLVILSIMLIAAIGAGSVGNKAAIAHGEEADFYFK